MKARYLNSIFEVLKLLGAEENKEEDSIRYDKTNEAFRYKSEKTSKADKRTTEPCQIPGTECDDGIDGISQKILPDGTVKAMPVQNKRFHPQVGRERTDQRARKHPGNPHCLRQ